MYSTSTDEESKEKLKFLEQVRDAVKRKNAEMPSVAKIQAYLNGSDGHVIKDMSPQFIENVNNVLEKFQNNNYVVYHLYAIVSEFINLIKTSINLIEVEVCVLFNNDNNYTFQMDHLERDGKDSRLTVADVRKDATENGMIFNYVDVLQTLLSKELPPEQVNGIINLKLMTRRNATDNEIENALVSCLFWF